MHSRARVYSVVIVVLLILVGLQTVVLLRISMKIPPVVALPEPKDEPMGLTELLAQISARLVANLEDTETIKALDPQQLTPAQLHKLQRIQDLQQEAQELTDELLEELD